MSSYVAYTGASESAAIARRYTLKTNEVLITHYKIGENQ